jgi:KDO2-lipid IV(A) lauroyltransferase
MNVVRLFRWGSKLAPLLPENLGNLLCDLIGWLVYFLLPARRKLVLCNLAHVLGDRSLAERKRTARRIFQTNIRNYYDLLRAYKIPPEKLGQMVKVRGIPEMKVISAQHGNHGIIAYSAHIGSFSLGAQVAGYNDIEFYLLVEPVKPPELFDIIRKLRASDSRAHTISVSSMEVREIFRALKVKDSVVCMAVDRDVTGGGVPLTFFDAKANLPTGTAEIALRTKALLVPVHVYKVGKLYRIDFWYDKAFVAESTGDKAADVERVSYQMLTEIETMIRKTPDQWVAPLQPIWDDCKQG